MFTSKNIFLFLCVLSWFQNLEPKSDKMLASGTLPKVRSLASKPARQTFNIPASNSTNVAAYPVCC